MATNAIEANITVSGNPFDLNDDEAEALLALEFGIVSKAIRTSAQDQGGTR